MVGRFIVLRAGGLFAAVIAALLPAASRAEFRHALVIGQSNSKSGPLAAPPQDVAAVADALGRGGFTVTKAENLATPKAIGDAVTAFAASVPTNGTALVYFSGHAVPVPAVSGTNPPRSDTALLAVDGGKYLLAAVLRTLVMAPFGPRGGPKELPCGSRINVVILDATPPPAAAGKPPAAGGAAAPAAPETLPPLDPPPDTLVVFRPAGAAGPSPLAARLVASLAAGKTLDAVLMVLSDTTRSSLAPGEFGRLKEPASRAVSPPDTLGPGPTAGAEWVDRNGMVFCWCPPGEFTIGSPASELEREQDELQAAVAFAEGFWMAKHEICYRESLPLGGQDNSSTGEHKLLPLNFTSPAHAAKILAAANATAPEGWVYGLPTEAEWEYAARAGTKTAYSFGDDPAGLARHGNFADRTLRESQSFGEVTKWSNPKPDSIQFAAARQSGLYSYAHPTWTDGSVGPARVAGYLPNAWGLHDMHGNVSEMTSTIYRGSRLAPVLPPEKHKEWAASPENVTDNARGYVCKGGSWASTASSCRSAFRGWTSVQESIFGLRLVLRRKGSEVEPSVTRWTTLVPGSFAAESGATATPATDGTVLVTGTVARGDVYTVTCPVPAGIEPREVRLELLPDPALPKSGPGRGTSGGVEFAEVSITAQRRSGPAAPVRLLAGRSDMKQPLAAIVDGQPETHWSWPGDGKAHEAVFTVGLPSRTGSDAARWRYPTESVTAGPISSLVVTLRHEPSSPFPPTALGKFQLSVLHEETTP